VASTVEPVRVAAPKAKPPAARPPAPAAPAIRTPTGRDIKPAARPLPRPALMPAWIQPLPPIPLPLLNRKPPGNTNAEVTQVQNRYQEAAEAQQRFLNRMMGR
jgi:hypothetical protein